MIPSLGMFLLETNIDYVVKDRWVIGSWKWNWRRHVKGGVVEEQLSATLFLELVSFCEYRDGC